MRSSLPNLLFITIDCLRPDILGCYGGQANTPHIDRLAGEGIRYTQAYSHAHFTRPAFTAIFSGFYPWQAVGTGADPARSNLVAQLLVAGYQTLGVNSNTWLGCSFGYDNGYTVYSDLASIKPAAHSLPVVALNNLLGFIGSGYLRPPYPSGELVTHAAIKLLESARCSEGAPPFFLWLHYMDAHWPYDLANPRLLLPWEQDSQIYNPRFAHRSRNQPQKVSPAEKEALWNLYRQAVEKVDRQVGLLLDYAGAGTAVILTSDHGEAFGEHGTYYHEPNLYTENVHVPLLLRAPGLTPGKVEGRTVRHIDLVPSMLSLAGISPGAELPGIDLTPSARGERDLPELPAISWIDDPKRNQKRFAVRYEGWSAQAVYRRDNQEILHAELYDTRNDPYEQVDLSASNEDRLSAYLTLVQEHLAGMNPPEPNLIDLDPEVRERLKALGYLE